MSFVAAAIVGGAVIGGVASNAASRTQAGAANNATQAQLQMFNQVQGNLAPYRGAGVGALNSLSYLMGLGGGGYGGGPQQVGYGGEQTSTPVSGAPAGNPNPLMQANVGAPAQQQGGNPALPPGVSPGAFAAGMPAGQPQSAQTQPQQTTGPAMSGSAGGDPGAAAGLGYGYLTHAFNTEDLKGNLAPNYNFQLGQGLGQMQNAAAAGGGQIGGNALQGMNAYAQNYAQGAYQQAFQNYTTNQNNIAGRLGGLAQLGQASATGSASGAPMFAQGISSTIQGAGQAQAAGQVGVGNAISGGLSNLGGYYYMNQNPGNAGLTGPSAIQTFEPPPQSGTGGRF